MAGSLIAAIFAGFFLFVLSRYGTDRISTRRDLVPAAAFTTLMFLALIASGLGLLSHAANLSVLTETQPLSSQEDLLRWSGPGSAVVTAMIAPDMTAALDDYVAYIEEEEGGFAWRPELELVLDNGARIWTTGEYEAANWGYSFDASFLMAGDPVVVIGRAVSGALEAEVLFRGRYEDFRVDYLPDRQTESNISLALAAAVGVGGLILSSLAIARIGLRWRALAAER